MAELLRTHTSDELAEWMAYEQVTGPLGPERLDIHMAILAATVSNANRGKGKKASPKDFLPKWDRGVKQPWQEMLAAVKQMNRRMGGTDLTTEGDGGDGTDPGGTARRRRDRHDGADSWRRRRG